MFAPPQDFCQTIVGVCDDNFEYFLRSLLRRRLVSLPPNFTRINVALTRARHQLVCVGDANGTLGQQGSSTLKNLVCDAKRRGSLFHGHNENL